MKPRREPISLSCSSFTVSLGFRIVDPCIQHRATSTLRLPLPICRQTTPCYRPRRSLRLQRPGGEPMGQRDLDSTESLLQELLWTYGPCGQEDAVRTVCARELQPLVDDMWTDDAGNLIGFIAADPSKSTDHRQLTSSISGGTATRVMAHMDELCMLVKRVEPDGTLHMTQIGVMYPGNF